MILDSTCGFRKMWKNKNFSNIIFMDVRREVKPDIVADLRFAPFRNAIFDVVYFDPPHHVPAKNFIYNRLYGWGLKPKEREELFRKANKEFYRILKKGGLVFAKTTNMPKNPGFSSKFMHLALEQAFTNFILYSRVKHRNRGKSRNAEVYWSCFRRKG